MIDADTGEMLTVRESFDAYPSMSQLRKVITYALAAQAEDRHEEDPGEEDPDEEDPDEGHAVYCRICHTLIPPAGRRRSSLVEPGTNPWFCEDHFDERLA